MNVFPTSNSTALQILKGGHISVEEQRATAKRQFGAPFEAVSKVSMQAGAAISAIINQAGARVDLSARTYSTASISARENATIVGGDGDDSVGAWSHADVSTGDGNDVIDVQYYANVDAGAGDDGIYTYGNATVKAGDGNDRVQTAGDSTVDGGAGNDTINGSRNMLIGGGAGNDEIRTYDHAKIDAGEGDDFVLAEGYSTVKSGTGNDTLIDANVSTNPDAKFGFSTLDGGEGDDYIQASNNSTVTGGTGNDVIRLMGGNATVSFNKGDGQDMITSRDDFALNIGGYSRDDVTVTAQGDTFVVSFKGSDEALTLDLSSSATARLTFDDGSTLDVTGAEGRKPLQSLRTYSDWSPTNPLTFYQEHD